MTADEIRADLRWYAESNNRIQREPTLSAAQDTIRYEDGEALAELGIESRGFFLLLVAEALP